MFSKSYSSNAQQQIEALSDYSTVLREEAVFFLQPWLISTLRHRTFQRILSERRHCT